MTQQPPFDPNQPQYPQGQAPQVVYVQQEKKKSKWWIWLIVLVVVFLALVGGCVAIIGGAADSVQEESEKTATVTYQVTGESSDVLVTYTTGDGNTTQENDIALPWEKEVTVTGFSKYVSVTVTNGIDGSGKVTCTIKQGDKVISTNTASGVGASASCSGSADSD